MLLAYVPLMPAPVFGWGFLLALVGLTAVAAVIDWRTTKIPKWLTISTFALGFVANAIRKSWLAEQGHKLWLFDEGGWSIGAMDGLLFALTGALLAFVVMFVLWVAGTCGGGDVKLFTAVGAWVGPYWFGPVLLASIAVLALFFGIRLATGQVKLSKIKQMARPESKFKSDTKARPASTQNKRRMTYSLPICVSVVIVMFFAYRIDLGLENPPAEPKPKVQADAK